jgi:hypothetical protein
MRQWHGMCVLQTPTLIGRTGTDRASPELLMRIDLER